MNVKRAVAAGVVLAVMLTGVAFATAPSGQTVTALGAGTIAEKIRVKQYDPADVQIVSVAFAPLGHTGWHSHPGAEVATVKMGSVTVSRVRDGECSVETFTEGQGFVAYPQDTFIVRNSSSSAPAEMVVVLFEVPIGGASRIDRADPGVC